MTLPVSKYEELLETVRNLKQQTIRVRELASPLLDTIISANITGETSTFANSLQFYHQHFEQDASLNYSSYEKTNYYYNQARSLSAMDSLLMEQRHQQQQYEVDVDVDDELATGINVSSSSESREKFHHQHHQHLDNMWHSEPSPSPLNLLKRHRHENQLSPHESVSPTDMTSVMSFASSSGAAVPFGMCLNNTDLVSSTERQQQLDVKVEMVYSLLSVLGTSECPDMGETLLVLSSSPDSSRAMRQAGCLSILVQLVHAKDDENGKTREKAAQALRNLVQGQTDEKQKKRELKILKLLEDIRMHCNKTPNETETETETEAKTENNVEVEVEVEVDEHPTQATENIIKLSFDEGYRHTICELGGIFTLARLIEMEHSRHGSLPTSDKCITLRRYAGMALTNLTFGHGRNKSLLCSFNLFIKCLVAQLAATTDELRQVTASVLRNLSWRADGASRAALRDAGAVTALMHAAMKSRREATLKSVLSALWNLSAHCSTNKADICAVPGALAFLVDMLGYRPPSTTLTIIENAGGILRNVSSHIAIRDDYRAILREKGCLPLLLQQLKSPSLTVVSNACGTLWNLSAKCEQDQRALWDMGAAPMLRSLNHSKHAMIATGSRAALKNLLSSRPAHNLFNHMDSTAREMGLPTLPTLGARKQRALAKDLDQNLSETCDNIEPTSPPQLLSPITCELSLVTSNTTITTTTTTTKQHKKSSVDTQQLVESFASLNLDKIEPIRNKLNNYSFNYDDQEQPIDYSQKYNKTETTAAEVVSTTTTTTTTTTSTNARNYSDYAETDLDQPTNYSLRYAENDSDSDSGSDIQDEEQFDTVKTYCTEGTPLNFSTTTSMSDLRQIDSTTLTDEKDKDKDKEKEKKKALPKYRKESVIIKNPSGLMTPEKPVKYCEEGTPRSFSRHSSFSSLNIDDSKQEDKTTTPPIDGEKVKETSGANVPSAAVIQVPVSTTNTSASASASATGAEETPLMFSRCSSLCSLSSAEQHSIHDDRSSIISDFSRLTSGIVSPSELPDSPTQTVPPSPRQRRAPIDFVSKPQINQQQQQQQLKSVFEDNVIKFKQANTPIEFSANTSLSSLTIDDELPTNINFNILAGVVLGAGTMDKTNKTTVVTTSNTTIAPSVAGTAPEVTTIEALTITKTKEDEDVDEQEEDDMLAACINIGIQNNRHREKKQLKQPLIKVNRTGIPIIKSTKVPPVPPLPEVDTTRVYCTEDTPAMLSHAGSQSDLSLLSVESPAAVVPTRKKAQQNNINMNNSNSNSNVLSDDSSSNLSGDNESNILAECIQSGMPKAKTPHVINNRNSSRVNGARDETATYAVEDSPCQFSLRSSLSDLTIDGVKLTPNVKKPISRAESLSSLSVESFGSTENAEQVLLEQCISSGMPAKNNTSSKNVPAPSVAPDWANRATDANNTKNDEYVNIETKNLLIENFTSWQHELVNTEMIVKNNHDAIDKCSDLLDGSIEDNCYAETSNRMLDPDAMIESLDRFTAELVSQSSHLQQSYNNDTWNEDTSPNDVSFPSISVSAPLVASFNSDKHQEHESLDTNTSTMTDSTLIAIEAANIVKTVDLMQESITDLEHMKPPSMMNSLVSLTSSASASANESPKPRKRSLPIANLMMRRVLTNKNSYENLTSISSCSNLDYMKPPSVMGDFLDLVDMENSMISVASITSETETLDDDKQYYMTCDNDNDSTVDLITDNVFHTCTLGADDVTLTEYSDANSVTPIQSDVASSSAESTPKKERSICMRMTPKQRRQYAKDRYKTYTVAAEMVIRQNQQPTETETETDTETTTNERKNKLTPKERRQLDRERFQTRVLDVNLIQQQVQVQVELGLEERTTIKQRRSENKERFRTQTLSSNSNSNDSEQEDLHLVLAQQANIVLDTLHADELLDCETLSLVSNDDESELNSVSSINYRTYHKSWGFNKKLPVVQTTEVKLNTNSHEDVVATAATEEEEEDDDDKQSNENKIPKIVKPSDEDAAAVKAVRGKRKPLYSSPAVNAAKNKKPTTITPPTPLKTNNIKQPFRKMTSNLVKNVTTTIKTTRNTKPPLANKSNVVRSNTNTSVVKQAELLKKRSSSNGSIPLNSKPLERQGTFTKDNKKASKIPESKIPTNKFRSTPNQIQNRTVSSTTKIGATGDFGFRRRSPQIHQSNSTQSLQGQGGATTVNQQNATIKRASNPDICANTSDAGTPKRKPVASRIASLWKKSHSDVGATTSKNKKIQPPQGNVKMRNKGSDETQTKRLSRLGSFIKVDEIPVT